jgi:hypothetical protein
MYSSIVCAEKFDNSEAYANEEGIKRRVRLTTGGDKSNYEGKTKADTADIQVAKTLMNAVISDPDAKFAAVDI